jgi:hypothetical protein
MAENMSFIGRGWSFPPVFNRTTGTVEMLELDADIISSLEILLTTALGERVMLPGYGCNLDDLIFDSLDTRMKTLIIDKIESAILYNEPRIEPDKISIDDGNALNGEILIKISYKVKTTNSRFNIVFPFYKAEGTNILLSAGNYSLED